MVMDISGRVLGAFLFCLGAGLTPEGNGVATSKPVAKVPEKSGMAATAIGVISNSGNGIGNTICIDNGSTGRPAMTVIANSRNGFGNRIIVRNNGRKLIITADEVRGGPTQQVGRPAGEKNAPPAAESDSERDE
jgi:hypothetical protein